MREIITEIISNKQIGGDVYELLLKGDIVNPQAGTFLELVLDGKYLRRPFSVHDYDHGVISVLYKVLGEGTAAMTGYERGKQMRALVELGHGFDTDGVERPLLIGGGIGIAPLYYLARTFSQRGIRSVAIMGFKNRNEVMLLDKFSRVADIIVCTDDGSFGKRGNAVQQLEDLYYDFDRYYACGPNVMLRALQDVSLRGQISLEARMACGFGACMGCSVPTSDGGSKRVCKDGPVFNAGEVIL